MTRLRLAVDVGGTFTDVAVERDGACHTGKVLTTPHDPVRGVHFFLQRLDAEVAVEGIG